MKNIFCRKIFFEKNREKKIFIERKIYKRVTPLKNFAEKFFCCYLIYKRENNKRKKFFLITHLYPYLHFVKNFSRGVFNHSVPIPISVVKTYPKCVPTGQTTLILRREDINVYLPVRVRAGILRYKYIPKSLKHIYTIFTLFITFYSFLPARFFSGEIFLK